MRLILLAALTRHCERIEEIQDLDQIQRSRILFPRRQRLLAGCWNSFVAFLPRIDRGGRCCCFC
jgi:hypothetical protein